MSDSISIRILEKDANRHGDLFGRLMADLFVALGYEQPRLNIQKSGRELDLSAEHRLEPRRAIGECKATASPVGGDDLNKFVGVLDAENNENMLLTGYFISLSGFKETAVEQEKQRRTRIITVTGPQVVSELVKGRILIPKEKATELAGRCCVGLSGITLDPAVELLAHERGWIWAIYYTQGKVRTHFALIHSDGTPLARALTDEVVASDRHCSGTLERLSCLNPEPLPGSDGDPQIITAVSAYGQYLANECGFIQLDGMPADSDVGSRRLQLESLFVPLHLDVTVTAGGEQRKAERQPVGTVLLEHPRLALLAAPGGGKSTLLKRLAVAYTDSTRHGDIRDNLPTRDWLPLFFRCRELRGLARASFADLLEALSQREPVRQHSAVFRAYVDRALLAGRVLLLVDGLDEISDPGDRAAFVCTVRTALQAYPTIAAVVTSREAGFRHVAAHLASLCTRAIVSPFSPDDIRRLSVAWHREVVGDTQKVRSDAEQLATTIVQNDRIRRLAVNPLLLTTLLLVKRWVGSLPTRRAVLYGKAVEVLLMTWNVEGHDPIPEEEAMPQLCYVASGMMLGGLQKVSRPRLANLLQEARTALPTELGYTKTSVDQFIHRVEDRSSLLMMTGHDIEDGRLVEFFEFRHLTFQEFLTARAMVEGWHPNRNDGDTLASVLGPHFEQEHWREVIPLAAVLGGKETEALIRCLTESVASTDGNRPTKEASPFLALVHSLADEAAARPETIRAAIREIVRRGSQLHLALGAEMLARGRYGADLREEAGKAFLSKASEIGQAGDALLFAVRLQTLASEDSADVERAARIFFEQLQKDQELARCEGAVGLGSLCSSVRGKDRLHHIATPDLAACSTTLQEAGPLLVNMVNSGTNAECVSALFALEHLAACRVWTPSDPGNLLRRFFTLWRTSPSVTTRNLGARALASQPVFSRDVDFSWDSSVTTEMRRLVSAYSELDDWAEKTSALVMAWYTHDLDDAEIRRRSEELLKQPIHRDSSSRTGRTLRELVARLAQSS